MLNWNHLPNVLQFYIDVFCHFELALLGMLRLSSLLLLLFSIFEQIWKNKLFNRFIRSDESRLRESISQLKTIRASIQSTIVEVEAIHSETSAATLLTSAASAASKGRLRQLEIEEAVMRQEMMARCQDLIKLFFHSSPILREQKAIVFALWKKFQTYLMFASKAKAYLQTLD